MVHRRKNTGKVTFDFKKDAAFTDTLKQMRKLPMHIGQDGLLQEWIDDIDDPVDNRRHRSHLYGLFPSNQISTCQTEEMHVLLLRNLVSAFLSHLADVFRRQHIEFFLKRPAEIIGCGESNGISDLGNGHIAFFQ
jgi:hypothetical protein